ncbi:MAG: sugar transferase [Chlamydiota bacterium]
MARTHRCFLQTSWLKDQSKRAFDLVFSLLLLIIGSPLFLLIAIGVYSTSRGPIIHKQIRIGKKGKPFYLYKFRTMEKNAENLLQDLLAKNESWKKEWQAFCKLKNDPRITPFGRFLRKTSLDELPQFWNVLWGDLSVVGPRPMFFHEIEEYVKEKAKKILSVKPGITGIWQVSGRSLLSMQERVLLEEQYVDRRSFFFDMKLIGQTIKVLVFSKGAY